jgi:antitoxin component YwqK of YwqJK toxin-antitoxin module
MKAFVTLGLLLSFALLKAQSPSFELFGKDTINKTDATGKKQGKWIVFGKHQTEQCYQPTQKVEEGKYKENRKTGEWIQYYCNGNTKNKVTYANGRPDGYAILYHENGTVSEEGTWKNNRWVGNFKQFYENGEVQHDFVYNNGGKREGEQKYFYENGNKAIEGNFVDGKENGTFKEYYKNGELKAEKTYDGGAVDVASIKQFDSKKPMEKEKAIATHKAQVEKDEKPMDAPATGGPMVLNGKHTLYNKNKQVTKDGLFKDNRLMDGKAYFYNDNGILTKISVYKNGMYMGDTQVTE